MALSTTASRIQYAGNGATTAFSFPYYFLASADIVVIETSALDVETTKTLTTHYTVSGAGVSAGGTITMLTAPATGATLTIYRNPTITQGLDLVENDTMPAESVEQALDRLTMISQRLSSRLDNVMRLSNGFVGTFDPTLPTDLAGVADAIPVTDATGVGWAVAADWPTTTDIADAEANAAAALASQVAAAASAVSAAAALASMTSSPTITTPTITTPTINIIKLDGQASTPSNPAAGYYLLYAKDSDGKLRLLNSSGVESAIGGGGGSTIAWSEGANSPTFSMLNNMQTYTFDSALAQELYCEYKVPASYAAGTQLFLKAGSYSADASGTFLTSTVSTLLRNATDVVSSTTNQRTSTNAAITASGSTQNKIQLVSYDLTDTAGAINSVAVAANDTIVIKLTRGTDTATGVIVFLPKQCEVT